MQSRGIPDAPPRNAAGSEATRSRSSGPGALPSPAGATALPRVPTSARPREQESNAAKSAIAAACVRLLRPGEVLVIDGGTTALRVAQELPPDFAATVVTHSVPVLEALGTHPAVEVIGIGGRLFKNARYRVGAQAVAGFLAVQADTCILGLNGLHPEVGLWVLDYESMLVKEALIRGARRVIAMAASDKLGTVAPFVFGPVTSLTHLVTDAGASDAVLAPYRDGGIVVLRAGETE